MPRKEEADPPAAEAERPQRAEVCLPNDREMGSLLPNREIVSLLPKNHHREIGILLPNNQRQQRTSLVPKDAYVLITVPYPSQYCSQHYPVFSPLSYEIAAISGDAFRGSRQARGVLATGVPHSFA